MFFKNTAQFLELFLILTINSYFVITQANFIKISTPPVEFPNNETTFPFIHNNSTILKVLLNTSEATEIGDLRKPNEEQYTKSVHATIHNNHQDVNNDKRWQTELIEDGSNTEETRKQHKSASLVEQAKDLPKSSEVQGQIAVIIAGAIIIIAIIAYAGFLSWRRFVQKRSGRQMLVNEEDFYEPNDMRDFSI